MSVQWIPVMAGRHYTGRWRVATMSVSYWCWQKWMTYVQISKTLRGGVRYIWRANSEGRNVWKSFAGRRPIFEFLGSWTSQSRNIYDTFNFLIWHASETPNSYPETPAYVFSRSEKIYFTWSSKLSAEYQALGPLFQKIQWINPLKTEGILRKFQKLI
jgi:hypothetical protein